MILLRPVDAKFPITQYFGARKEVYKTTNGHNGVDYGLAEGNPVRAAAHGVVERAELDGRTIRNPKRGYGYHIRLLHPDDSRTIYAHLQEDGMLVKTGEHVLMGDLIGKSGNTGFSDGPHLHFEYRLGTSATSAVDPLPFIVDETPPESGLFAVTITPEGDGLRIRRGPGLKHGIIRSLRADDVTEVFGLAGKNVWLRIEEGYIMFNKEWVKISAQEANLPPRPSGD